MRRGIATPVLAFVCAWAAVTGCGEQGEAERCDTRNRNEDCEAGLVCVSAAQLQSVSNDLAPAGLCCPPEEQLANLDPACIRRSALGDTDGGAAGGSDGGDPDAASLDAAQADAEPGPDSSPPAEAGTGDAAADAP